MEVKKQLEEMDNKCVQVMTQWCYNKEEYWFFKGISDLENFSEWNPKLDD